MADFTIHARGDRWLCCEVVQRDQQDMLIPEIRSFGTLSKAEIYVRARAAGAQHMGAAAVADRHG